MSPTRPDVCRFMGATSLHMLTIAVAATEAASDASVGPASAAGNEPCPNSPTGHSHPTPHSLPVLLWLRFSLFCFAFPAIFFVALASFALAPVSPGPHLLSFDLGMLRCCSCFSLSNRPLRLDPNPGPSHPANPPQLVGQRALVCFCGAPILCSHAPLFSSLRPGWSSHLRRHLPLP